MKNQVIYQCATAAGKVKKIKKSFFKKVTFLDHFELGSGLDVSDGVGGDTLRVDILKLFSEAPGE